MARAADAVRDVIRQNQPPGGVFEADLTGGTDSRSICALLQGERFRCRYYTGGTRLSPDVVLARRIAQRLSLDWTHVEESALLRPMDDPEDVINTRLRRMTLWSEGLVQPTRIQTFPSAPSTTRDDVYLGGGSAEISKAPYYRSVLRGNPEARFHLDRALADQGRRGAELLGERDASRLAEALHQQLRVGADQGLHDWALLDHFYLRERTRRWQSAHLAVNLFEVDVLPFVNADHVALAFAMSPRDKAMSAFQRFVILQNDPTLLRITMPWGRSSALYVRLLGLLERIRWLNRAMRNTGWADYLRGGGRASVERTLSGESPVFDLLDRRKALTKWGAFLRGRTQDLHFPLGLLAFSYWHSFTLEEGAA
jgi:hypothetical protein